MDKESAMRSFMAILNKWSCNVQHWGKSQWNWLRAAVQEKLGLQKKGDASSSPKLDEVAEKAIETPEPTCCDRAEACKVDKPDNPPPKAGLTLLEMIDFRVKVLVSILGLIYSLYSVFNLDDLKVAAVDLRNQMTIRNFHCQYDIADAELIKESNHDYMEALKEYVGKMRSNTWKLKAQTKKELVCFSILSQHYYIESRKRNCTSYDLSWKKLIILEKEMLKSLSIMSSVNGAASNLINTSNPTERDNPLELNCPKINLDQVKEAKRNQP